MNKFSFSYRFTILVVLMHHSILPQILRRCAGQRRTETVCHWHDIMVLTNWRFVLTCWLMSKADRVKLAIGVMTTSFIFLCKQYSLLAANMSWCLKRQQRESPCKVKVWECQMVIPVLSLYGVPEWWLLHTRLLKLKFINYWVSTNEITGSRTVLLKKLKL